MGSHALEICSSFPFHCPDTAKMLHLQAGETCWLHGQGRFSQQQRFLEAGAGLRLSGPCQLFTCCTQSELAHVTFTSGTALLSSQAQNIHPIREKKWLLINQMWDCPCCCHKMVSKQKQARAEQAAAPVLPG